jgi:branched-chain amino acid transport system permease protein
VHFGFLFSNFAELTITGLALGAIYALVALGYTMVYGVLQLINFAHSEVFMFGTFAMAWVVTYFHGTSSADESLVGALGILGLCLVAAMLASTAVAFLVERLAYRPLIKRGSPKLVILISAIGASFSPAGSISTASSPTTSHRPATPTPRRSRSTRTPSSTSPGTASPTSTCW